MDSQPPASENAGNSNSQVGNSSAQSWASFVGNFGSGLGGGGLGGGVVPPFPFSLGSNSMWPGPFMNSLMKPYYGDKRSLETEEPTPPLPKKKRVSRKKVKTNNAVEEEGSHQWKEHWVIHLITLRGEMQETFWASQARVDNWSRLYTRLVSICPDFSKDAEACRKKWATIYYAYKEDKACNLKSGSNRSEKCKWYALVDDYMHDRAHVVSHAHGSAQEDDTIEKCEGSNIDSSAHLVKSVEKPKKHEQLMEQCLEEMRESGKQMMESLKATEDIKITLLMSMQETMKALVEKL